MHNNTSRAAGICLRRIAKVIKPVVDRNGEVSADSALRFADQQIEEASRLRTAINQLLRHYRGELKKAREMAEDATRPNWRRDRSRERAKTLTAVVGNLSRVSRQS